MKFYKLNQGSTFENLKTFIYITNEYGVPSAEFVDGFIEQFGKIILNNNFKLNQYELKQLNSLWSDIVNECKHNSVEYVENYGNMFYYLLGSKAMLKIKEGWEESEWNQLSEQDKLELLKKFILDFDKHIIDGMDMQDQLFFENTKELIKKDSNSEEYIKIHMNEADRGLCTARLYKNGRTVIEIGSYIGGIAESTMNNPTLYNNIIKARNGKVQNNIVISEIECKSPSGAGQVYRGFTCNGWVSWYNEYGELIDNYREQSITSIICNTSLEKEDVTEDKKETELSIDIKFKESIKYRSNPLILYDNTTKIEMYHPTVSNTEIKIEYIILKSNNPGIIGNKYTDINKLIKDTNIDFYNLKYSHNSPITDLIIM